MDDKYMGSTAERLDYFYGNSGIRLVVGMGKIIPKVRKVLKENKIALINGLENTLKENVPEYGGVTRQDVGKFLEVARKGDFESMRFLKKLDEMYQKIRDSDPVKF